MRLSVNILTWNCLDVLKLSLDGIMEEIKDLNAECIIVDNGSNDGTVEFIAGKLKEYKNLQYIFNFENLGISVGKNLGVKASQGDYIMLVDGDVWPVKNSIRLLLEYMEAHPEMEALGYYPNEWSNQLNNKFGQVFHETVCEKIVEITTINRCCIYYGMFRKSMFDKIMFSEEGEFGKPGYGWEDFDFTNKMVKAGIQQYVCHINKPNGKYYHRINSSIRAMGRNKYMETSEIRRQAYHEKWGEYGKVNTKPIRTN